MDDYIGTIRLFVGNYAPKYWLFCQGQTLSSTDYPKLFAIIGNTYGGSGTNFNLPDLRNVIVVGTGAAATGTNYALGVPGGSAAVTLNGANLPSHTHFVSGALSMPKNADNTDSSSPVSNYPGSGTEAAYNTLPTTGAFMAAAEVNLTLQAPSGQQNTPVPNIMPSVPINYLIAVDGNVVPPN